MTLNLRVRALQRRKLRIAGTVIPTDSDGTVLNLDAPRVAQEFRTFNSYPFGGSRFYTLGEAVAGMDTGAHSMPVNKAKDELTYVKGGILWNAMELGAGETIASVTLYSGATALNTGTHQYVGLYKLDSAGLLTQVAVTADGTSGAWAASSAKTFTFSTAHKTEGGGTYYVALLITGTTAPTLVGRKPFSVKIANLDGPAGGYELETALTGSNNDLRFYGSTAGVTITYTDPGALGAESVGVVGTAITVTLANDSGPAIISTAATILATINGDTAAHALVTAALLPGNDGTGAVTALATTPLTAAVVPVVAVSGASLTALPATLASGALTASNLEAFFTLA